MCNGLSPKSNQIKEDLPGFEPELMPLIVELLARNWKNL